MRQNGRSVWIAVVGIAVTVGSACGDDGKSSGDLPLNEVEDAYVSLVCETFVDCQVGFAALFNSTQDCVDFINQEGDLSEISAIVEAVEQGRISYDASMGAQCMDDMRAQGCDAFITPEPQSCRDAFSGSRPINDGCRIDDECGSGWCDTRQTCPGVCADPAEANDSCALGEKCAAGLDCVEDVCVVNPAPLGLGEHCAPDLEWCAFEYYCDQSTETCTARKPSGADCAFDEECAAGMFCPDGQCVELQLVTSAGDSCNPFEGRVCDIWNYGLVCVMDFSTESFTVCAEAGQLGDPCVDTQAQIVTPCDELADVYCDYELGDCVGQKAAGQTCSDSDECLSGDCDWETSRCVEEEPECWEQG